MTPPLAELAAKAKTSTESEARLRLWLETGHAPSPAEIRMAREWLGLGVKQFAVALGFSGENADRTVLAFEAGHRDGKPFAPTSPIASTIRMLVAVSMAVRLIDRGAGHQAKGILLLGMPKNLREP